MYFIYSLYLHHPNSAHSTPDSLMPIITTIIVIAVITIITITAALNVKESMPSAATVFIRVLNVVRLLIIVILWVY